MSVLCYTFVIGMPQQSLLTDELRDIILELLEEGCSVRQMASILEMSPTSIQKYLTHDPSLMTRAKLARWKRDRKVEDALFQRAVGYAHPEEKIFCSKDGIVTRVETTKHYPPDTAAAAFWLKNRQQTAWKDRHELAPAAPQGVVETVTVALPDNGYGTPQRSSEQTQLTAEDLLLQASAALTKPEGNDVE